MSTTVEHRPETACFEAHVEGQRALCSYHRRGGLLVLHHTEVPPALQGRGLAADLVAATLAWARTEGLRVRPTCSYVAAYMRRHADTQDLLEAPPGL